MGTRMRERFTSLGILNPLNTIEKTPHFLTILNFNLI